METFSNKVQAAKDFIKWHVFRSAEGELTITHQNDETSHEALLSAINELEKEGIIITNSSTDKITIKVKQNI